MSCVTVTLFYFVSMYDLKKKRIPLIDGVRGIMILYVVLYHLLYDLCFFGLADWRITYLPVVKITHFICYSTLVAFSGISCSLSHNNLKRGCILLGEGLVISFVTFLLDSRAFVRFGVLHFLGMAAILWWLLERFLIREKRLKAWFPLLMLLFYGFAYRFLYTNSFSVPYLGWLGFPTPGYTSTDYFPIIPFFFLYLFGVWIGRRIKDGKAPFWFYTLRIPGFQLLGRYSIWIYLAHQPLLYGFVWLLTLQ